MQNLLTFLPFLVCPLAMGIMMWLMMRGNQTGTVSRPAGTAPESTAGSPPPGMGGDAVTTPLPSRTAENAITPGGGRDLFHTVRLPTTMRLGALCFNPKVLVGLAFVGLGLWVAAPQLVGAALPILLVAACPLSMLFMMQGMRGGQRATSGATVEPVGAGRRPGEQLADLQAQLARTQAEQAAITRAIAQVEAETMHRAASAPSVPDSVGVAPARSPEERVHAHV